MSYISDVLVLMALFAIYGCSHSLLASLKFKNMLKVYFGKFIAFYRLIFNFFALLSLYLIWEFGPHPSLLIYEFPYPYDLVITAFQIPAAAGIIWCFKYICFKEFIGISQINRLLRNEYDENDLDEKMTFRAQGPYKFSRHPLYLFSILFLLFRPEMNLFYLIMFVSFVIYFYIGSVYEERKLVKIFGEEYIEYQNKVSRIFPFRLLISLIT